MSATEQQLAMPQGPEQQNRENSAAALPEDAANCGRKQRLYLPLLLPIFIALFSLELLAHIMLYPGGGAASSLLPQLCFSLAYALAVYAAGSLFSPRFNYALIVAVIGLFAFLVMVQYGYFQVFRTPFLLYSLTRAADAMDYSAEAWHMIIQHIPQFLLFALPGILLALFARGRSPRLPRRHSLLLLLAAALAFLLALGSLSLDGKAPSSAYSSYYNENSPAVAQEKLGLITSMRLDLQRNLFGFTPREQPAPVELPPPAQQEAAQEQPEETPASAPNILDIDFASLVAAETDDAMRAMHLYFAAQKPSSQNEYTGLFAGKNLIMITAEGFSHYLIDPEFCPTIHRLATEGFHFTDFYTPIWNVSTSDGEYVAMTGLLPKSGVWSLSRSSGNYMPFALGNQFAAAGYEQPLAYHNHSYTYYDRHLSHPNLGYDFRAPGHGLDITATWPESDVEMMENSVDDWIALERFHVYYMTVSGHLEYNFSGNNMALRHRDEVADLPYSDQVRAYIACNLELEQSLAYLLARLEQAGRLKDTVIVLSADHYPYGLSDTALDELAGHAVERNFELYRNGLIIWQADQPYQEIAEPVCSLDILPTVSNLFGLPYDSRLLMGRDVFSDALPLVIFNNRSWITDIASYNAYTGEIKGTAGEDYASAVNQIVAARFNYAARILETDYYRLLLED